MMKSFHLKCWSDFHERRGISDSSLLFIRTHPSFSPWLTSCCVSSFRDLLTLIIAPVTVSLCVAQSSGFPLGSSLGLFHFSLSCAALHPVISNGKIEKADVVTCGGPTVIPLRRDGSVGAPSETCHVNNAEVLKLSSWILKDSFRCFINSSFLLSTSVVKSIWNASYLRGAKWTSRSSEPDPNHPVTQNPFVSLKAQ